MLISGFSEVAVIGFLTIVQAVSSGVTQVHVVARTNTACRSEMRTNRTLYPSISATSTESYQNPPVSSSTNLETHSTSTLTIVLTSTLVNPTPTGEPVISTASYMEVVKKWRTKMGMKTLAYEPALESNAMNTVVASKGAMVHKLNPGSLGQVLAPGDAVHFEHVFVGGWLCEIPSLPGLGDVCLRESDGWAYNGQTGHAEILISSDYSKIGCALFAGIWCCDLA
jgi:hypothetical protein